MPQFDIWEFLKLQILFSFAEKLITCSFSFLDFSLGEKVVSWVLASGADRPLHLSSHPVQLVGHPTVHSRGSRLNFVLSTIHICVFKEKTVKTSFFRDTL